VTAPIRTDALSLTLPTAKGRTWARHRKRPPNWKRIVAWIVWDVVAGTLNILSFATDGDWWGLAAAVMFSLDLVVQIRRLGREDGGYRMPGEDALHGALAMGIWLVLVGHFLLGLA